MMKASAYISILLLIVCCDREGVGSNLSRTGFYATDMEIINAFSGNVNNYKKNFLLANAFLHKKEYKSSIKYYANSCFKNSYDFSLRLFAQPVYVFVSSSNSKSPYYDDAVYHIASIFYEYKEYDYVLKFLRLIKQTRLPGLHRDALFLAARTRTTLKQEEQALKIFHQIINKYPDQKTSDTARIRLASIYNSQKKYNKAIDEYLTIIHNDPKDWQSSVAVGQVIKLLKKNEYTFTNRQKLLLARVLYFNKKYSKSLTLLKDIPQHSMEKLDLLVRNNIRIKKYSNAITVVNRQKNNMEVYKKLLYAQADELWMVNRKRSVAVYRDIIKLAGNTQFKQEAIKKIALYMLKRKQRGYKNAVLLYVNQYRDQTAQYFLWSLSRQYIKSGKKDEARKLLIKLINNDPDCQYTDRARFWLYKIFMQKKNVRVAINMFKDLVVYNPGSSYTWYLIKSESKQFSRKKLLNGFKNALSSGDKASCIFYHTLLFHRERSMTKRNSRLKKMHRFLNGQYEYLTKALKELPDWNGNKFLVQFIDNYFSIGYREGIVREINFLYKDKEQQINKNRVMLYYSNKYNNYYYAVLNTIRLLRDRSHHENIAYLPDQIVRILYPRAFYTCIQKYGKQYKIDPFTLLAVIKAESLFNHSAVSSAGAVGLMQLMPSTAKGIAQKIKRNDYDLKKPCDSILLGCYYINWLKKYLKDDYNDVFSAYNAGAGRIKRWKRKMPYNDKAYFIEFIPYRETRYYVLRITRFREIYNMIYN